MKNQYQQYKKTAVESASREKILLMLYEAAIRFTKMAIVAAEKKNIAERGMLIGRVYDIVLELNNTLNHKVGGDLSKNLEQLYIFITDQLIKANAESDISALKSVLKILETLYAGWSEAIESLKRAENSKQNDNKNVG